MKFKYKDINIGDYLEYTTYNHLIIRIIDKEYCFESVFFESVHIVNQQQPEKIGTTLSYKLEYFNLPEYDWKIITDKKQINYYNKLLTFQ